MSVITAQIVRRIIDAAAREGLNRRDLLQSCGLDPDGPIDSAQTVPAAAHYGLWETILGTLRSPGFPIRHARGIRSDDYGAFGLATKTAATVQASLQRAERYLVVLTNTSQFDLSELTSRGTVVFRREGARRLGMRCANEAALAEMVAHTREVAGVEFPARRVCWRHSAPADVTEHQEFFGCPVEFDQDTDSVEFERAVLDLPLPKADDGLSRFVLEHLDKLVSEASRVEPPLEQSLRALISEALPDGPPSMGVVARRMGMSKRTLARRLADANTTFQQIAEDTRRQVAKQLLRRTEHSLGEITFLLGFSEQSAFQRAFKRWTGSTPSTYRAGA